MKTDDMNKMTPIEEQVMRLIWKNAGGYIKDFLEELPDPKPPYTTLASTVKNLEKKGFVKAKRYGNTYWYQPLIEEDHYKRHTLSEIVNHYFANSYKDLVSFFAKDEQLAPEELEEILQEIAKGEDISDEPDKKHRDDT